MIDSIRFAYKTRRAWWFTASSRTRERFARTTLGSFWLGLSNLLSIGALAFVYGAVFKVEDFRSYVVYLGIGLVTWNTIASAIGSAPNLLRTNAENIKNTNIDPIFYTMEEWSFQVQTFAQSFGLVLLALTIINHSLLINFATAGFIPLINLLLFIYWFPLIICLIGANFEDFFQLIPIIVQLMFLLSPILYNKEALGSASWTATFNPIFRILSIFRNAIISGEVNLSYSMLLLVVNLMGAIIAINQLAKKRKTLPFML